MSAFTDRVCIQSNVTVKALRSAQQMTSCCHKCGYGCRGGWPWNAWDYLKREGAVTGGDYGSEEVSFLLFSVLQLATFYYFYAY